jgi:hypothetical protein
MLKMQFYKLLDDLMQAANRQKKERKQSESGEKEDIYKERRERGCRKRREEKK